MKLVLAFGVVFAVIACSHVQGFKLEEISKWKSNIYEKNEAKKTNMTSKQNRPLHKGKLHKFPKLNYGNMKRNKVPKVNFSPMLVNKSPVTKSNELGIESITSSTAGSTIRQEVTSTTVGRIITEEPETVGSTSTGAKTTTVGKDITEDLSNVDDSNTSSMPEATEEGAAPVDLGIDNNNTPDSILESTLRPESTPGVDDDGKSTTVGEDITEDSSKISDSNTNSIPEATEDGTVPVDLGIEADNIPSFTSEATIRPRGKSTPVMEDNSEEHSLDDGKRTTVGEDITKDSSDVNDSITSSTPKIRKRPGKIRKPSYLSPEIDDNSNFKTISKWKQENSVRSILVVQQWLEVERLLSAALDFQSRALSTMNVLKSEAPHNFLVRSDNSDFQENPLDQFAEFSKKLANVRDKIVQSQAYQGATLEALSLLRNEAMNLSRLNWNKKQSLIGTKRPPRTKYPKKGKRICRIKIIDGRRRKFCRTVRKLKRGNNKRKF